MANRITILLFLIGITGLGFAMGDEPRVDYNKNYQNINKSFSHKKNIKDYTLIKVDSLQIEEQILDLITEQLINKMGRDNTCKV